MPISFWSCATATSSSKAPTTNSSPNMASMPSSIPASSTRSLPEHVKNTGTSLRFSEYAPQNALILNRSEGSLGEATRAVHLGVTVTGDIDSHNRYSLESSRDKPIYLLGLLGNNQDLYSF